MPKVIIEAAINGDRLREQNRHVPYSADEIAAVAAEACHAGASIIHFHTRSPDGGWIEDIDAYTNAIRGIRKQCAPIIWPTVPLGDDPAERFSHYVTLAADPETRPDIGSVDLGSLYLPRYDPASRTITGGSNYINSLADMIYFTDALSGLGMRPFTQVFDASMLRMILVFLEQGRISEPLNVQFYFGGPEFPFGLPPTETSLNAYLEQLEGLDFQWFAGVLGASVLDFLPMIVQRGGHVRIGLEDFHYRAEGELDNVEIIARAATAIRAMGYEIATVEEARAMLRLDLSDEAKSLVSSNQR